MRLDNVLHGPTLYRLTCFRCIRCSNAHVTATPAGGNKCHATVRIKARAVAVVQLLFSHGPWDAPKGPEEITIGAAKADTQEVVDIDVGANGFKNRCSDDR